MYETGKLVRKKKKERVRDGYQGKTEFQVENYLKDEDTLNQSMGN